MANADLTIERIEWGGVRTSIRPETAEIHAAVMALVPTRDIVLLLRDARGVVEPYELSVTPVREQGMSVCARRDRELRWVARGDDTTPMSDGDGLPAKLLVPPTWASSALAHAAQCGEPPRTMPWHDGKFVSLGPLALDEVSFARCVADPQTCVRGMATRIAAHLAQSVDPERAADDVIAELRRVGHDLWSLDHDGGSKWGSDYMRSAEGQGLYLELSGRSVQVRFGDARADAP